MTDPAKIARNLTKPQRDYLLSEDREPDFSGGAECANWSDGDDMWDDMSRKGLVDYWTDTLPPLGQQVRAILKEQDAAIRSGEQDQ